MEVVDFIVYGVGSIYYKSDIYYCIFVVIYINGLEVDVFVERFGIGYFYFFVFVVYFDY